MGTEQLQYYIHDESDAFRLELSGNLSGDGAQSVYLAWRTGLSIVGERPVIVDITFVNEADDRGRVLLNLWQSTGARIVAGSVEAWLLAKSILKHPIPEPPAKKSWLQQLFAGASSHAENSVGAPAAGSNTSVEFREVAPRCAVECRLPW